MRKIYAIILSVATLVLCLDQWTKFLALGSLSREGQTIEFLSWFQFTLVHNHGVAFGMLQGLPESIRKHFLLGLTIGILVFLWFSMIREFTEKDRFGAAWSGLVVGGALGNLIDRYRYGYVVDFIDWFYKKSPDSKCLPLFFEMPGNTCHWPVFNIADSAISSAIILWIFYSLISGIRNKAKK